MRHKREPGDFRFISSHAPDKRLLRINDDKHISRMCQLTFYAHIKQQTLESLNMWICKSETRYSVGFSKQDFTDVWLFGNFDTKT